jgi:hypothetical protein
MEGLIFVIAIGWFVFSLISRGLRAANQSGQKDRPGQAPPQGARPRPPYPPLTPTAQPGQTGAPDWGDIMTMLGGAPTQTRPPVDMEGESTESSGPSGSMTSPSMMEGSPSMFEGPGMMDGKYPVVDLSQPSYEGASLPGKAPAPAPQPEISVAPPLRPAARPGRYDPAALRSAVVWAEILAKPKSLRRVAR